MKPIIKKISLTILSFIAATLFVTAQTTIKHIVDRGETLESIARRYATTEAEIVKLNREASQFIYVGMELTIPVNVVTQPNKPNNNTVSYLAASDTQANNHSAAYNGVNNYNTSVYDDDTVDHKFFAVAQYQIDDLDFFKESGSYGLGMVATSIGHRGRFHIGANVNFSINAGLVDDWGCIIDFGPSVRVDICRHLFINVPVDARCIATFPEGSSDTETSWGGVISPSLHGFLSEKFGLFAGPHISFAFSGDSSVSFGLQAGISYSF